MVDPPPRDAEALLVAQAELDLDEGLDHLRGLLRRQGGGALAFLARGLELAVLGALTRLEVRPRLREDVRGLCALARRAAAGENPAHLWDAEHEAILRFRQLGLLVRVKDDDFAPLLAMCREAFVARLPDLSRMVAVADPEDYDDLVRKAFPDRRHVEEIVRANHHLIMGIVAHARTHPHLLRLPSAFLPRMADLAVEVTEWQTTRVLQALDRIYGAK